MITALINVVLGAVVFVSLVGASIRFQDRLDWFDRMALCGLAGSMLMTTPALFIHNTPFDGWAFNLSRFFLAVICVRRFFMPIIWEHLGERRNHNQVLQSGKRIHDRLDMKL